jgi:predicted nuclease with RNAse H fold
VRALGIDVSVRRGLDLVVLEDARVAASHRHVGLEALPTLLRTIDVDVIAIDSPPSWALQGKSRQAERDLARLGIHAYAAPTAEAGEGHTFYEWMRVGFEVFRIAERAGFPGYRGGPVGGTAIEVFPHATAVVLAGCLPPRGNRKAVWRASVLRAGGVDADGLRSLDQIDAALAALTGLRALAGRSCALGDPREGVIVLPARALPARPYRRAPTSTPDRHRRRTQEGLPPATPPLTMTVQSARGPAEGTPLVTKAASAAEPSHRAS